MCNSQDQFFRSDFIKVVDWSKTILLEFGAILGFDLHHACATTCVVHHHDQVCQNGRRNSADGKLRLDEHAWAQLLRHVNGEGVNVDEVQDVGVPQWST